MQFRNVLEYASIKAFDSVQVDFSNKTLIKNTVIFGLISWDNINWAFQELVVVILGILTHLLRGSYHCLDIVMLGISYYGGWGGGGVFYIYMHD
jgi:hypothetical protein